MAGSSLTSPGTYGPLQAVSMIGGATTMDRYTVCRVLSGAAASPSLLSLTAQHSGPTVDTKGDDFALAQSRLLPR